MTVWIRMARADDVPGLVQLRIANGERHAALNPSGHRVPDAAPVRRYFEELLSGTAGTGIIVLVAEAEGTVEQYAAGRGVVILIAPILAPNTDAVSFYSRAGFGPHGVILSKKLTAESRGNRP